MPVLNVSSRVTWLELDDKALLESYAALQEGILCDVFSQKCSAAWQGAPGQRLTVAIMLPGRQIADDWLDFMLSQRNLWPTFTTKRAPTEVITEKTFCVCWVCVVCVCFVCFLSVLLVKTPAFNSRFTFFCEFLVVDRPCPVLARQCRKKKLSLSIEYSDTAKSPNPLVS